MATLSTVFNTIASNPNVLQNPDAKMLFNKILLKTNTVSPLELSQQSTQQQPAVSASPGAADMNALPTQ